MAEDFGRVASPVRDYLSLPGLFAMDEDETDSHTTASPASPVLLPLSERAAPPAPWEQHENSARKARRVKHLREIPAGALLQVLGDQETSAPFFLPACLSSKSTLDNPKEMGSSLLRLCHQSKPSRSCSSIGSNASNETIVLRQCDDDVQTGGVQFRTKEIRGSDHSGTSRRPSRVLSQGSQLLPIAEPDTMDQPPPTGQSTCLPLPTGL